MKHILLIAFVLSMLMPLPVQARPLKPSWKVIPGGVQKCVYDAQVGRNVCTTHCNVGYKIGRNGQSCVAVR